MLWSRVVYHSQPTHSSSSQYHLRPWFLHSHSFKVNTYWAIKSLQPTFHSGDRRSFALQIEFKEWRNSSHSRFYGEREGKTTTRRRFNWSIWSWIKLLNWRTLTSTTKHSFYTYTHTTNKPHYNNSQETRLVMPKHWNFERRLFCLHSIWCW